MRILMINSSYKTRTYDDDNVHDSMGDDGDNPILHAKRQLLIQIINSRNHQRSKRTFL